MSFWPFSNSFGGSSQLQKFLDSVQDMLAVTAAQLLEDRALQVEFVDEVKHLAARYGNRDLLPALQNDNVLRNLDAVLVASTEQPALSKTAREAKLLELLLQPHILNGFVEYIAGLAAVFECPADDGDGDGETENERARRCVQGAADVLLVNLWVISNRIIETPAMDTLWLVLELSLAELLPTVTYLVQILDHLMDSNSIEMLNYVRRQRRLAEQFVAKVDIPILMDFLLKVIQSDRPDLPLGILEVLHEQRLIPRLVDILRPGNETPHEMFRQTAAAEFIKALVTISSNASLAVDLDANIGPNQLTRELASPRVMGVIVNEIILSSPPNKHAISNCVSILIELIRKNNSDYDCNCGPYSLLLADNSEVSIYVLYKWLKDFEQNPPGHRDPVYLGDMLQLFSEALPRLVGILDTTGTELGLAAFKVLELIAELLHCSNMILLNSVKTAKIIALRDRTRQAQQQLLQDALAEPMEPDLPLDKLTLDDYVESDDEEPAVSPESPFVCELRDAVFRERCSVGDYFKIQLVDLGMLARIVQKLEKHPWHNLFHNVLFDLVQQIFNGKLNLYNSFLIVELFKRDKCNITGLIMRAFGAVQEPRPGYMGHLILISEEIVKFTSLYKPALISPVIVDAVGLEEWERFVADVLLKTRELYNVILGSDPEYEDKTEFGFDAATVGHMDMEKDAIILGDSLNQEQFLNAELDVQIQSMLPNPLKRDDMFYEEFDSRFDQDDFLDDLLGSSSLEDDEENQLRRIPKHDDTTAND